MRGPIDHALLPPLLKRIARDSPTSIVTTRPNNSMRSDLAPAALRRAEPAGGLTLSPTGLSDTSPVMLSDP